MTQLPIIQAHAVSGHKSQGQTLEHIIITKLYDVGIRGLVSMLNDLGWFYTAVSRTKTRGGLKLDVRALPTEHIKAWRLDFSRRWHVYKCSTKKPEFACTRLEINEQTPPTAGGCKMRATKLLQLKRHSGSAQKNEQLPAGVQHLSPSPTEQQGKCLSCNTIALVQQRSLVLATSQRIPLQERPCFWKQNFTAPGPCGP